MIIEYDPPIAERSTEELIAMAHGTTEEWQQEVISQARAELIRREITPEQQEKVLRAWSERELRLQAWYEKKLAANATESYSTREMILIFLGSPFIFAGGFYIVREIFNLRRENYRRKARQRIALLAGGIACYLLLLVAGYTSSQHQWQQEVDCTNISKWEKNHIHAGDSVQPAARKDSVNK